MATREVHRGIVHLDPALVVDRLCFPPGTEIIDARFEHWRGGTLALLLEHPSLPPCEPGCEAPVVRFKVNSEFE